MCLDIGGPYVTQSDNSGIFPRKLFIFTESKLCRRVLSMFNRKPLNEFVFQDGQLLLYFISIVTVTFQT